MKRKLLVGGIASAVLLPILSCLALGKRITHTHRRMLQSLKIGH